MCKINGLPDRNGRYYPIAIVDIDCIESSAMKQAIDLAMQKADGVLFRPSANVPKEDFIKGCSRAMMIFGTKFPHGCIF